MERFFKGFCVFMSALLLLSSLSMVVAVARDDDGFDLFSSNDIVQNIRNMEINMTSVIYVKNDNDEWEEYQRLHGEENRIWVSVDKIPQTLIDAFIAIEDERFFSHRGVDWRRTFYAFANKVFKFTGIQGGSTLTQQLIKNVTGDNARVSSRKVREIIRALLIEGKLEKNEILEAYLNTIALGNGICGVQVAANYYFNKDVSELNLLECAAIASITKNPSAYNPIDEPKGNKERRQSVLDKMYELGKINKEEYLECYDAELKLDQSQKSNFEIPVNSYFVDTLIENIKEDLMEKYGCSESTASSMLYNGGYKIYATLDTEIQKIIDKYYLNVNKYFYEKSTVDRKAHLESGMTIMDYEGHIVGIVGGVGKKTVNLGLNRAYNVPRQPGSTMKPLGAYAPALDSGVITYSSYVVDEPLKNYYPDGKQGPREWYGYYAGKMSVLKALERSANTIPCKLVKEMGVDVSFDFLTKKLKMKNLVNDDKNLSSLALGGCIYGITPTESAAAFAIFGNNGKYFEPVTYYKVETADGKIELQADKNGSQVIKPATASIMNKMLQNVVYGSEGTGTAVSWFSNKHKAFAKTGTSTNKNDNWLVGGTPYYVASVWCGFDKSAPVSSTSTSKVLWRSIISEIHKNLEKKEFTMSEDIIEAKYCKYTGLLAGKSCNWTDIGYYVPGVDISVCDGTHTNPPPSSSSEEASSSEGTTTTLPEETTTSSETVTSSEETTESTETSSDGESSEDTSSDESTVPPDDESDNEDTDDNESSSTVETSSENTSSE